MSYAILKYGTYVNSPTGYGHATIVDTEETFEDAVLMAQLLAEQDAKRMMTSPPIACGDSVGVTGSIICKSDGTDVLYVARREPMED